VGGDLRYILNAAAALLGVALWASMASATAPLVTLHWTAPGDDSLSGRATTYDLRYSLIPITAANFSQCIRVQGMSAPLAAGSRETYTISGLTGASVYYFALKTADEVGNWSGMSNVFSQWTAIVGVDDPLGPQALQFSTPQPNPARGTTAFVMGLPSTQDVHIAAYDVQGRIVKTLLSGTRPAGTLRLVWNLDDSDGRPVSTGIYLIRARLGTEWFERRVTVVR
jgi:hypothetical protein